MSSQGSNTPPKVQALVKMTINRNYPFKKYSDDVTICEIIVDESQIMIRSLKYLRLTTNLGFSKLTLKGLGMMSGTTMEFLNLT